MTTSPETFAPTTTLYVALLAIFCCALAGRVVVLRIRLGTHLGDGGDGGLLRAIRAHGNFAEYVPVALLLLVLLELNGAGPALLHAGGALLLVSRAAHAYGVSQMRERLVWRLAGMAGTFIVVSGGALGLLVRGLARL